LESLHIIYDSILVAEAIFDDFEPCQGSRKGD